MPDVLVPTPGPSVRGQRAFQPAYLGVTEYLPRLLSLEQTINVVGAAKMSVRKGAVTPAAGLISIAVL